MLVDGMLMLSFDVRYNIEDCGFDLCDYVYVEVDDGSGWVFVFGLIMKSVEGNGIDGVQASYALVMFDLFVYVGKTV